jgi:hypothetical protein
MIANREMNIKTLIRHSIDLMRVFLVMRTGILGKYLFQYFNLFCIQSLQTQMPVYIFRNLYIKPYVVYADSHPGARSGFVDDRKWQKLDVEISEDVDRHLRLQGLNAEKIEILKEVLAQDPRPHYQKDPHKVYGMPYEGLDIHFTVCNHTLTVVK